MSSTFLYILASLVVVSLVGFVGVLMLIVRPLRQHSALLAVIACAAGTLMGDAFLHLLPEAVAAQGGLTPRLGFLVLAGFLGFFLFEALIRWQHVHGEGHEHEHEDEARIAAGAVAARPKPFGWVNLASDGLHNFVDGAIIAAAYIVDFQLGLATTIAVLLHEVPTEFGDFGVLLEAGIPPRTALLYNFGSALMAIAGGMVVYLLPSSGGIISAYGVPMIAGAFIYIAAADLIPELHHHGARHVPMILAAFVIGVGVMGALLLIEA